MVDSWRTGTQSVDRAVQLLRLVSNTPDGLSAKLASKSTGLNAATTYRLLQALEAHGLVVRDGRKYVVGRGALTLASTALERDPLHKVAIGPLTTAARLTGDCITLLVRHEYESVCLGRAEGQYAVRSIYPGIGSRLPLGVGPGSLLLLSFLDEAERQMAIDMNRNTLIGQYFIDELTLHSAIDTIRRERFARDPGKLMSEVYGLAVLIMDHSQKIIGTVSISALKERVTLEREEKIFSILRSTAEKIASAVNPVARHQPHGFAYNL